uniref:DNA primase large subunit C-terminal domain-containing protein n=1 Tax=Oryza rufipogon TaxID=4529 RepID=A0A0E0Q718_ORYRU
MEIVRSHRQIAAEAAAGVGCGGGAGGLPTYRVAPQLEVRLEEFELFAIDRLRVLKGIADGLSRGKRPEEMEKLVVSLVVTQFRCNISKALVLTNRKWTATIKEQEKDRLTPIVEALSNAYFGPDYSQLRENHHLKHGGRMQFGLFLKGAGLKLEDALAFWRAEFSQKVGSERFDKEYAYSIRHNYGKEGKRTDYTPYSCQKIISATPGVGDHHGCPYRHFGEDNLRAALNKMGISGHPLEEIMDKVKNRHYQLACTMTFEAEHGVSCDTGINHPNQYFSESQKVLKAKNSNG